MSNECICATVCWVVENYIRGTVSQRKLLLDRTIPADTPVEETAPY